MIKRKSLRIVLVQMNRKDHLKAELESFCANFEFSADSQKPPSSDICAAFF